MCGHLPRIYSILLPTTGVRGNFPMFSWSMPKNIHPPIPSTPPTPPPSSPPPPSLSIYAIASSSADLLAFLWPSRKKFSPSLCVEIPYSRAVKTACNEVKSAIEWKRKLEILRPQYLGMGRQQEVHRNGHAPQRYGILEIVFKALVHLAGTPLATSWIDVSASSCPESIFILCAHCVRFIYNFLQCFQIRTSLPTV